MSQSVAGSLASNPSLLIFNPCDPGKVISPFCARFLIAKVSLNIGICLIVLEGFHDLIYVPSIEQVLNQCPLLSL